MRINVSRRSFLTSGAFILGGLAFVQRLMKIKTKNQPVAAKFLTQDGKLVEVLIEKVPIKKISITKKKLVSWIWKDRTL